ncbi:MAG TPA: BON domain-containing protein [Nitrospira sp.]|nr:BON domain-containing protein [Nitrospira sp.]
MKPYCRALICAGMAVIFLFPLAADKALSDQAPAPDHQPAPPKLSSEPAQPSETSTAKPEPAKLSTEPKSLPQSAPPTILDVPPEREAQEKGKEKDIRKKPLGSLILTIKLALLADARLFRYEIEVGEDGQNLALGGRVSSEEDKAAATEIARAVADGKTVVNKLEVDKGLVQALGKKQDEIISTLVKDRFAKSATLKAANFEVKTEEGVVSISGAVRFQVLALEAAEAARLVPGVKAVKTDRVRLGGES